MRFISLKLNYKLIVIFLIISVLSISIPVHQVNAGPLVVVVVAAVAAGVVYDYVSCNFNVLWGGCGDSGGSGGPAPTPTLNNQTATPIINSDKTGTCTTGFTLNYSVTDAYQYGIYRDGNIIKQGTLNTIVQPSPYNTSFSYTDSTLAPNINYLYKLILTDKNGKQYQYPECNFSADPAVIEVLPATSTLSWDCRYYGGTPDEGSDSCSINQGVGSVSPLNDSVSVRPSQETTYTLTCSTVDKTSDYQASVKSYKTHFVLQL